MSVRARFLAPRLWVVNISSLDECEGRERTFVVLGFWEAEAKREDSVALKARLEVVVVGESFFMLD